MLISIVGYRTQFLDSRTSPQTAVYRIWVNYFGFTRRATKARRVLASEVLTMASPYVSS